MRVLILTAGIIFTNTVFAAGQAYVEISHLGLNIKEPRISAQPSAIKGILGWQQGDNLTYEALVAFGVTNSKFRYGVVNGSIFVNSMVGFYAKGTTKISENTECFLRAGIVFTKINLEASVGPYQASQNISSGDLAYGLGIKHRLTKDFNLAVDYSNYYNKANIKIHGLGIGVGFNY